MDKVNSSGGKSATTSNAIGLPTRCRCGAAVVPLTSRSYRNPGRRFLRCAHAVSEKLSGDDHVFKWIDDALVDEVGRFQNSVDRLENVMVEELESHVMWVVENYVMPKVERLVEDNVERLVMANLDNILGKKIRKLVGEQLDKLVMEKVQEEIFSMKLN